MCPHGCLKVCFACAFEESKVQVAKVEEVFHLESFPGTTIVFDSAIDIRKCKKVKLMLSTGQLVCLEIQGVWTDCGHSGKTSITFKGDRIPKEQIPKGTEVTFLSEDSLEDCSNGS